MTPKTPLEVLLEQAEKAAMSDYECQDDSVQSSDSLTPLPAARPDITKLRDALDEYGLPVFEPGTKIVIERRNVLCEGHPYLDTQTYTVRRVDMTTGDLVLWNEELTQFAMDNFVRGTLAGQIYKLAGRHLVTPQRKRGRPRKNPLPEVETPKVKGKRGRPPGSKNRPKEVVRAEKEAKRAARKATPKKRK